MNHEKIYQQLLFEIDRSIVMDDNARSYWLKNYRLLPFNVVEYYWKEIKTENEKMDRLIAAGIDADPELGEEIIKKGQKAKKQLAKFQEKETREQENPEEFLQKNL